MDKKCILCPSQTMALKGRDILIKKGFSAETGKPPKGSCRRGYCILVAEIYEDSAKRVLSAEGIKFGGAK